jgi:predicted MPP superfamily phosphohydrolase
MVNKVLALGFDGNTVAQDICILQISDLHRDPANPIRNDALLDSLENDRRRYALESECKIRSPDIIIVSGDVIQGVKPGTGDPDPKLDEQYREALDFMERLTDRLVGGDRERVVIVPGNHDASACHAMKSMKRIDIVSDRKKELLTQLFLPGSLLRWSWADFELYEINDAVEYERRFAAFARFYSKFYCGRRSYSLDPAKQFDIFDFPDFNVTISSFSSCFNNDILNKQGVIHPNCIADAGMRFRAPELQDRLRIAVWHHNTEGPPARSDYMDPETLQNLIDRGFSLGFHGHQHRPQFLNTRFRYGSDRRITVVSAGTLCGSASFRFGRAYNLIELDTAARSGRFHLREMLNPDLQLPIWGQRPLPPNVASFLPFEYDPPPTPLTHPDEITVKLILAQRLYEQRDYAKAADLLEGLAPTDQLARRLLLDCLRQLGDRLRIIANFNPPVSSTEAIFLMDALWEEGDRATLRSLLKLPVIAGSTDPSIIEQREKFLTRLKK